MEGEVVGACKVTNNEKCKKLKQSEKVGINILPIRNYSKIKTVSNLIVEAVKEYCWKVNKLLERYILFRI